MVDKVPAPPKGTGCSGRALWRSVVEDYSLEEHEALLLKEACRCADLLDELAATIAEQGSTTVDGKLNPALREAREQKICLARLITAMRLPAGDEDQQGRDRRPQRRSGVRGVYQLGSGGF